MTTMRAAIVESKLKLWSELKIKNVNVPQIEDDEVLIEVRGRGVNDEDLLYDKFKGLKGVAACPGFECSGVIVEIGANVKDWQVGDWVCAIADRGCYADRVAVPHTQLFQVDRNMTLVDAAGLPYYACMLWLALCIRCENAIVTNPSILIRDGASAMGVMAIQVAKHRGMTVIATEGTTEKIQFCRRLGAHFCFDHTKDDIPKKVVGAVSGIGVDYVLDNGISRVEENIMCCSIAGKLVIMGLKEAKENRVDLEGLIMKHLRIRVVDMETKSKDAKAWVVQQVKQDLWPALQRGIILPNSIHCKLTLDKAEAAHEIMKNKENMGKILLV